MANLKKKLANKELSTIHMERVKKQISIEYAVMTIPPQTTPIFF